MTDRRGFVLGTALAGALGAAGAARGASTAAGRPIFVLNSQDADVSVVDPRAYAELRRIRVGKEPHHLYLTPDEKSLIVANAAGNSLTFIDPATGAVQRTIADIVDPYHLRFSPDMKWFVTAANRLDHVDLYRWQPESARPFTLVKRLPAPKTPSHLAIDSRSTYVVASLQDSDELLAVDLATQAVRWKVKVGRMPADVFLTADDRTLLIGMTGADVVEAYDVSGATPKLIKRITTGKVGDGVLAIGLPRYEHELIRAFTARQGVISRPAVEVIISSTAIERVIAPRALQIVGLSPTDEGVVGL